VILNFILVLYLLLIAPKLLWERLKGKRHPALLQRLGFHLPKPDKPVFWIHAVSVGEIKAAQPLFNELKSQDIYLFVSTTTATGMAEAKRSLPGADFYSYLPLDFTWVVSRFIKALNPIHFILVESDFWPNLLKRLKKNGTRLSLVSGKMSPRSAKRFAFFSFFSKRLFALFDHVCVQNEEYFQKFLPFTERDHLHIAGNLKLDLLPQETHENWQISAPVITVSCTHAPEEELILDTLLDGPWTLLIAPRHPERFSEVAELLKRKSIPFGRFSEKTTGKVVLIDAMGKLPICYRQSRLTLVGGSFTPGIGGHNVLEPCLYGTPVLFGPFTFKQNEFVSLVLKAGAGQQIPHTALKQTVELFFSNSSMENRMREGVVQVTHQGRGATEKTLQILGLEKKPFGKKPHPC
jgi:3-deoxy-D-manno-octulosonic-acid transferase